MPETQPVGTKATDSARAAQATLLEVTVTIQGSKPVDGQEKRELFTETTKTTLVFANGAVVNLKSRLLAGQCVFLRNEISGREILCKVLESRQAGQTNYTDLEFTAHDPNFWEVKPEQAAAAPTAAEVPSPPITAAIAEPGTKLDPQQIIEAAVAKLAPQTPVAEADAPVSDEVPEIPAMSSDAAALVIASDAHAAEQDSPEPEDVPEIRPVNLSEGSPENVPEPNEVEDAAHLASLIAMDDKIKSKREPPAAETIQHEAVAARKSAPEQERTNSDVAGGTRPISELELRLRTLVNVQALKNPVTIGIAASVLLAATLGIAWHAKHVASARNAKRGSAALAASKSQAPSPAAQATQTPVAATPAPQLPGAKDASSSAATTGAPGTSRAANAAGDSHTPSVISVAASIPGSDQAVVAKPKHRKGNGSSGEDIVPPKIVSQSQPGIPEWAKGLDTNAVVQLDAVIDEKGNVTSTKPLSGPRLLQREAERVVALWVFEPAMSDGKPTTTHMVLTVQFQM